MKKLILFGMFALVLMACEQPQPQKKALAEERQPMRHRDTVYKKIVKDLKEVQETQTDYHTKLNVVQSIWDGDVKTSVVPDVSTKTSYYVIYTDGTHVETTRDNWLNYSRGDTIGVAQTIYY